VKERLAASLADTRAELGNTLTELRGAMRDQLDVRAWVRRSPWVAVALAAFVGYRLARSGGRR
jgi:ElaB/YqjD/DUF883 family membrane-anchored ribosome-binding protein